MRFGVGPILTTQSEPLGHQLCASLSRAADTPITLTSLPTYPELLSALVNGGIDLAWLPPILVDEACESGVVTLLVGSRRTAGQTYRSAIIVREDSPIVAPEDLRNKTIVWVDRSSASGYLFARAALQEENIVDDDFSDAVFAGSHADVVRAVKSGRADAGATYCGVAIDGSIVNEAWKGEPMRAVLLSADIPADAVCISDRVETNVRNSLAKALTELHRAPDGPKILQGVFGCARFEPTLPRHYRIARLVSASIFPGANRSNAPGPHDDSSGSGT